MKKQVIKPLKASKKVYNESTVSLQRAVDIIEATKKPITLLFVKQNDFVREIEGIYHKTTKAGYISIISFEDKGYRNVNPETLKYVIVGDNKYRVRK